MRTAAIRARTYFPPESSVTAYHAALFHGFAKRKGLDSEDLDAAQWSSLQLIYNLESNASIIQPKSNLPLRWKLLESLQQLISVRAIPVEIIKYVRLPFDKGDMSCFEKEDAELGDYAGLLRKAAKLRIEPELEVKFAELCLPLMPSGGESTDVVVEFDAGVVKKIPLSPDWLTKAKGVWAEGCQIIEQSIAEVLLPHINYDYIEVRTIEI